MTLPNFLIIGTAKSGTTSLHRYLREHPEIYMSSYKEPRFFAYEGANPNEFNGPGDKERVQNAIRDIESYQKLFEGVTHEKAIGEASPIYLYYSNLCSQKVKKYIPNTKIIVLLRHPVDRAFSMFLHHFRGGFYRESAKQGRTGLEKKFIELLETEEERIQDHWTCWWHYKNMGFYFSQIQTYFQNFNPNQISIYFSEELKHETLNTLQNLFNFLEVDESFVPNFQKKYNVSKEVDTVPKNEKLHNFLMQPSLTKATLKKLIPAQIRRTLNRRMKQYNMEKVDEPLSLKLSPETRKQLTEIYREDILKLQDLLDRDLSHWLQ